MSLRRITAACLVASMAAGWPAAAWAGPAPAAAANEADAGASGQTEPSSRAAVEAPPAAAGEGTARPAEAAVLELPPLAVEIEVRDEGGRRIARVGPSARPVTVGLAPGTYVLAGPGGAEVRWTAGSGSPDLPAAWRAPSPPPPKVVAAPAEPPPAEEARVELDVEVRARAERLKNGFLSALLSALVPGMGQIRNGEPGKGVGILLSAAGLLTGTVLLWPRPDPHEGTGGRRDDTRSAAEEVARLAAFAAASGGFGLLYAGQVFDAWQGASGESPRPDRDFLLRIETAGMYTISAQPGQPSHRLLQDFNVSFMFEPGRRFTLGFSDIGGGRDRATGRGMSQVGMRVGYRVFDRRRLWVTLSLGGVFQSVGRDRGSGARGDVGGFVYGQLGLRIFVTNSISLALLPRLSVPVAVRYYAFGGALPRFAPTLEMGGGIGVHF